MFLIGSSNLEIHLDKYFFERAKMETKNNKLWSSSETNKFIYQQLKTLCEANGFVVSPKQTKHLVRIGEHHIQIVHPEVLYTSTRIHMRVSPAASFASYFYCQKTVYPRKSNNENELLNSYDQLAVEDPVSWKLFYDGEQMQKLWRDVIGPQFDREIIAYFNSFGFEQFASLSEHRENGTLTYCTNPACDDAVRFLAMGEHAIWKGQYEKSIPLLEKAISGYQKEFEQCKKLGHELPDSEPENYHAVNELLSILKKGDLDMESHIRNKLAALERTALNKTWGVALSPEGKTVRLKKKERL